MLEHNISTYMEERVLLFLFLLFLMFLRSSEFDVSHIWHMDCGALGKKKGIPMSILFCFICVVLLS